MKLKYLLILILMSAILFAEVPYKFSYQAVIRNSDNNLISDRTISMRIRIHQGSENGDVVYTETHVKNTNMNGLVSLQIGSGTVVEGNLTDIDWSAGPYFIRTETDPQGGTDYSISGVSELLSVPYAIYSLNGVPGEKGEKGDAGPQGPQGEKGEQGPAGSGSTYGTTNYISKFTPNDSTIGESQIFDDGTFVGIGTNEPKAKLDVNEDILVNGLRVGRGASGNDASVAFGYQVMDSSTGASNTAIGGYAMKSNTSGLNNTSVGTESMMDNTSGSYNVAFGWRALENNTEGTRNAAFGGTSLQYNTTGSYNTAIGPSALARIIEANNNTAVGYRSAFENITGNSNTTVGNSAMYNNTSGNKNTVIGDSTMLTNLSGSFNTIIGANADVSSSNLTNATAIGANATVSSNNSLVLGSGVNVGIGTSNPVNRLHIVPEATIYNTALFIESSPHDVSNRAAIGIDDWFILQDITGDGTKNFAIYQGSTNAQRLVINTNGNIGIGTNEPAGALHVANAPLIIENSNQQFYSGGTAIWEIYGGTDAFSVSRSGIDFPFGISTSTGNSFFNNKVGIGTDSPSQKLTVTTNEANNYAMSIFNTANSATANGLTIWAGSNANGILVQFIDHSSGVEHGTIKLVPSGVNYVTASDERLKKNINDTKLGLDALSKISIKDYEFIDRAKGQVFQGILAQDLFEIYPQAVTKGTDELNEKGLPTNAWGIDYGKLTPLIIKSVQEMKDVIDAQQKQIDAQQKQIDELIEILKSK